MQFHQDRFPNPAGLVEFLQAQAGQARIKDNKLVIARAFTSDADRIKGAFQIAKDLAEKAAGPRPTPPESPGRAAESGRPAAPPRSARKQ